MPPKSSKGKTSFKGVWLRPSGKFGVEFQCDDRRYWLGTFESANMPRMRTTSSCGVLAG